jgi:hypothetical protein
MVIKVTSLEVVALAPMVNLGRRGPMTSFLFHKLHQDTHTVDCYGFWNGGLVCCG